MKSDPISLAVLVSGAGTTLQNLIDEITAGRLNARIDLVVGSRPGLAGVERAKDAKLATHVIDRRMFPDACAFSRELFAVLESAAPTLVCCAGWLCLLDIPRSCANRIMNIHPALLPSFGGRGMFGRRVHEAVIEHGCKISGCTVHFVDNEYDAGPIILQRTCPVLDQDTPESLARRVFEQEKIAYPDAIRHFAAGQLHIDGRRVFVDSKI